MDSPIWRRHVQRASLAPVHHFRLTISHDFRHSFAHVSPSETNNSRVLSKPQIPYISVHFFSHVLQISQLVLPMRKLVFAFVVYVVVMIVVAIMRPNLVYDHEHQRYRSFGVGSGDTLLPMWLLAVVVAALSYLLAGGCAAAWAALSLGTALAPRTTQSVVPATNEQRQQEEEHVMQKRDVVHSDDENTLGMLPNPMRRRVAIGGMQPSAHEHHQHHPRCAAAATTYAHSPHHPRCAAKKQAIDKSRTRHADSRQRRNAVASSRVWANVMR